jgi:hypothetical protein
VDDSGSESVGSGCRCPEKIIQVFFVDKLFLIRGRHARCFPVRSSRLLRLLLLRKLCR